MTRARLAAFVGGLLVAPLLVLVVPPGTALAAPSWQLPFRCGQVWSGATFTTHNPANAVDLNRTNDDGDPVVAAAAGRVSRVENTGSTSYGRWIEIDHGGGYASRYAHLSAQRVSVGQQVYRGQLIGNVGSTGGTTGPHLHFEERLSGTAIKVSFNGAQIYYWGTRSYTSHNCPPTGTVNTAGSPLTVRSGPGTSYAAVGSVADGATVTILCQRHGQTISGTYGTTDLWDYLGNGYVSDAYVFTGSDGQVAPSC